MILSLTIHLLTPPPPPPPPLTLHSHLTSILPLHGYFTPFLYQHSHLMSILSLHGHLKSILPLQTGTLMNLPLVILPKLPSPKLVFNSETEQCFSLDNQLIVILILILYVLGSQTPIIRLESHPSYMKQWCFID